MSILIKCDGGDYPKCQNIHNCDDKVVYPLSQMAQNICEFSSWGTIEHLCAECFEKYNEEGLFVLFDNEILDRCELHESCRFCKETRADFCRSCKVRSIDKNNMEYFIPKDEIKKYYEDNK